MPIQARENQSATQEGQHRQSDDSFETYFALAEEALLRALHAGHLSSLALATTDIPPPEPTATAYTPAPNACWSESARGFMLETVYQQAPTITGILRRQYGEFFSGDDIDDIVQETAIALDRAICYGGLRRNVIEERNHAVSIILTKARQLAIDAIRHRRGKNGNHPLEISLEALLLWRSEYVKLERQYAYEEPGIIELEADDVLGQAIKKAFPELRRPTRLPIILHSFFDLTATEIAEILDLTAPSASVYLSQARKVIRAYMPRH